MDETEFFLNRIIQSLLENKKEEDMVSEITAVQSKLIEKLSDNALIKIRQDANKVLKSHRLFQKGFNGRLMKRWQKPIDLLELELLASFEIGSIFNSTNRMAAAKINDYLFDVLTRQHARSCLIGYEVLTLLKNGLPDGAFGRWRSLHETVVISFFIQKYGQQVAERFLKYEVIESYKQALVYNKYCKMLGYQPIEQKELDNLNTLRQELVNEYGKIFAKEYGWVPETISTQPNFAVIEASSGLGHLRPYYKMACFNVHSGPKSIKFNLGLMENSKRGPMLLASPSNYGLADPGQATAIALYQMAVCLLTQKPTIKHLVILRVLGKLVEEIEIAFVNVQKQIEEDENEVTT